MTSSAFIGGANLFILALFIWSLIEMTRLMLPEKGRVAKTKKAVSVMRILYSLLGTIGCTAVLAIFIPKFAGTLVIMGIYVAIQFTNLITKRKRLEAEIRELHQTESIFSLSLGTHNKENRGVPINLWFKKIDQEWPKAELEVGVGIHSLPVEQAHKGIMEQMVVPRIADALKNSETPEIQDLLATMRDDLHEVGITHPLDIGGWDKHPVIKAFLEKIFEAKTPSGVAMAT